MSRRGQAVSVSHGADAELQRLQARWNQLVAKTPILGSTVLEDVTPLADGAVTRVPHGLGRPPVAWMVVRQKYNGKEYATDEVQLGSLTGRTFNHGLGGTPTRARIYLRCLVTEGGYGVGDYIDTPWEPDGTGNVGFSLRLRTSASTTATYLRKGTGGIILINTTGGTFTATGTSWQVHLELWRERRLQEVTNLETAPNPSTYLYLRGHGFTGSDKVDLLVW